jgi:hypothetical protein
MKSSSYIKLLGNHPYPLHLGSFETGPEDDDALHDPDASDPSSGLVSLFTWRGLENVGCLIFVVLGLIALFAVLPIAAGLDHLRHELKSTSFHLGRTNATGQVPVVIGNFGLIDNDTPQEAYTHKSFETGEMWDLVFSDEFNRDGRSFYPGDDPYWQAEDFHYWGTSNLEWSDPRQTTTENGHLRINLELMRSHDLNFEGTYLNTWNKFCFTGGYVEASVSLPGKNDVYGLWPAIWAMGNLGRAGYGGTVEGLWPYSYNECDVGTLPNQTLNGEFPCVLPATTWPGSSHRSSGAGLPDIATTSGPEWANYTLSYLPGQRLSRCTCPDDETHPGPKNPDGSWVGRAAPEIDMFEAQVSGRSQDVRRHNRARDERLTAFSQVHPVTRVGHVSLSAQWAPFDPYYQFLNTSSTYEIYDRQTDLNEYLGGPLQQTTSAYSVTDPEC